MDENEEEDGYWLRKAMELSLDQERDPSPEQEARFKERLAAEIPRIQGEKRRAAQKKCSFGKMSRRAAMVALLVVIVAGSTLSFASEAFAGGVSNFFTRLLQGGEELRITEKENAGFDLDMSYFEGMYFPNWIPNGYRGVDSEITTDIKSLLYESKEGNTIRYYIYVKNQSVAVDNEEVDSTPIYLHDSWGKCIEKEESISIIWEDTEFIYVVRGPLEEQDKIIKMAECAERISTKE